ncbi:MAG: hypothetical protein KJ674_01505 [Nanoarchaeota archaeon]|nr:hypothetical protein [Nanoarchaeota archaeon]
MGYIRYKVADTLHKVIKETCKKMGLKESELSRTAIIEYLKSLDVFNKK